MLKEINQEIEKAIAVEKSGAAKIDNADGSQADDKSDKVDDGGDDDATEKSAEREKTNGDISSPKPTVNGTVKMTPEAAESKSDTEDNEKSDSDEKSKPNVKP